MSDKLIKASDAVDIVAKHSSLYGDGEINTDDSEALLYDIMSEIMNLPSAGSERKMGEWIPVNDNRISGRCSICGWEAYLYEDDVVGMDYCPNCGARLEEKE